ncbi:hypothetical protein HD554DRAFT_1264084 [Boletus coccyginus]|nr:hypothetical protein HD554DRAFT_1264084 [Boletus coccyginus]
MQKLPAHPEMTLQVVLVVLQSCCQFLGIRIVCGGLTQVNLTQFQIPGTLANWTKSTIVRFRCVLVIHLSLGVYSILFFQCYSCSMRSQHNLDIVLRWLTERGH